MDLSKIARNYVERLIEDDGKPKILLLDSATIEIISLATTQSYLLKKDVFLVDRLDNTARQKMRHLRCVCFVRPSSESLAQLIEELRSPRYGSYAVVFSNLVRKSQLERLAEADDNEAVTLVQEMFLDYYTVNSDFLSAGIAEPVWSTSLTSWETGAMDRSAETLISTLLSLKFRKPQIRIEANSGMARKLSTELVAVVDRQASIFDQFPVKNPAPLVLILDRLNDPITPLLSHWTYQAMVDELIGIRNNRVDISAAPDIQPDQREIVLSQSEDAFFADVMFLNWGDLGAAVVDYVSKYKSKSQSNTNLDTVADMKRFVEEYPEFRRLGGNVAKHVALVGELSRLVDTQQLYATSGLEQSLACTENHNDDLRQLQELISSPQITTIAKYRLVALYTMRYRRHANNATAALLGLLESHDHSPVLRRAVENLMTTMNSGRFPQEDLFSQGSLLTRAQQSLRGLQGVENVLTQHTPLLETTLQNLSRGKLSRDKYPVVSGPTSVDVPPQDVFIFMVGGASFEEARLVTEFSRANPSIRVVLGGTSVANSERLLEHLGEIQL